jgi:hypothetical protein
LQEVEEDEAPEQALDEVADGFVGLVLIGFVFVCDDAESGALWAASEILQEYSERLEGLSNDLMQINREQKEQEPKKKKK